MSAKVYARASGAKLACASAWGSEVDLDCRLNAIKSRSSDKLVLHAYTVTHVNS